MCDYLFAEKMQGIKTRASITSGPTLQNPTNSVANATEASKMLEAALQQMDGIISGASVATTTTTNTTMNNNNDNDENLKNTVTNVNVVQPTVTIGSGTAIPLPKQSLATETASVTPLSMLTLTGRSLISPTSVLSTAQTLALALQQVGVSAPTPDATTAAIISDWLETHIPREDTDDRLLRLHKDKEALTTQYQLLADRVSEQTDKIIELEGLLTEKTAQLSAKEELLQRQVLSRSALETQKMELMSALSELKLHRAALERENAEFSQVEAQLQNMSNLSMGSGNTLRRPPYGSMGNLYQNSTGQVPKTPPSSLRHQIHPQFHSLPRSHAAKNHNNNNSGKPPINNNNNNNNSSSSNNKNNNSHRSVDANANSPSKQRNVAFASNEKILIEDSFSGGNGGSGSAGNDIMYGSFISNSTPSPNLRERSAKGLRQIFGKLRRSNSGNLELPALEQAEPEFRRGGARATAGGRIEWTTQTSHLSTSSKGYADWSPQEVCNWLCDLGLGCYEDDCRKWLKSNPSVFFFNCAPQDIEKELNLKMPLHRKKIILAIDELTGKEDDLLAINAAQLDINWVLRWLDDIGLPQYKDAFLLAKLDGRMLHRLTIEDLAQLHVNSCLHIASLRRGIQCMREMNWNPECLIRRSTKSNNTTSSYEKDDDDSSQSEITESIALWTAHRVMEWLRVADLSEYAPNLRGAGVHGALMLYEPRFNANLLADLLSIPPSKTLLRRHLAMHFKELLGRDVIQAKRDAESAIGYQALTITAKLKLPKKTQFSLKRRKSNKGGGMDLEWTDYVCPMTIYPRMQEHSNSTSLTNSSEQSHSSSPSSKSDTQQQQEQQQLQQIN